MTALIVNEPTCRLLYTPLAVTGEADAELLTTASAHGLSVNDAVLFTALTGGTGLAVNTIYYVKTAPGADTLTLAATVGGATLEFSTDVTAGSLLVEALDLDDYLVAVNVDVPSDAVDIRTFGGPRLSDVGGGMDTITLSLLWDATIYELLAARQNVSGTLWLQPDSGDTPVITATVQFAVAPFGNFTIGGKVEAELVLGVEDGITYAA